MSKKNRDLTSEEKHLWRRVTADVKARARRSAVAESEEAQDAPAPPRAASKTKEPGPAPQAKPVTRPAPPPPQNRGAEKRVRRGRLEIGATLDLHGHTQDSARAALAPFFAAAQARGDRTVIVVTGVGRAGEGVLKRRLPEWLAAPALRDLISGYAPAHRTHGGQGAFYVFIKRAP